MSAIYVFIIVAVLAALAGCYRLVAGPTRADRVIALDLLFAVAVVLCICAALVSGSVAFLDVALGLALVGFVATIAWARLIDNLVADKEENR